MVELSHYPCLKTLSALGFHDYTLPYVFRLLMEIREEKAVKRNPVECIVMKAKG